MAVTVGFEPTVGVNLHNISSVAPSAARTRHRGKAYDTTGLSANRAVATARRDKHSPGGRDLGVRAEDAFSRPLGRASDAALGRDPVRRHYVLGDG